LAVTSLIFATVLTVAPLAASAATISQTSPTAGNTTPSASLSFADQLEPTTDPVSTLSVNYVTVTANPNLVVSSSGVVSTVGAPLSVGNYTVSGTDDDGLLDSGAWTYTLTVTDATINQGAPLSSSTNAGASSSFTDQLSPTTTFGANAVSYVTGVTNSNLLVSSSGAVSTVGGPLVAGPYTVSGTDSDAFGDTGTWSYTLTVTSPGGGSPPPPGTIKQSPPTSGVTTTASSANYTNALAVTGATGVVSFATNKPSSALNVSAQGAITTSGAVAAGSYSVSGTDFDPAADVGTWTFTLTVNPSITVTFVANGGAGSMSAETESAPTALSPNVFTRTKHVFAQWNTAANGSGTSYANGASYPFVTSTTLYAQWIATTHVAPKHTVTFKANGGHGSMSPQKNNVLASLDPNSFNRAKFTFSGWNTVANGSGKGYAGKGAYSFTKSVTLYAQWTAKKVATHVVTFKANGGRGSMAPESNKATAALTSNKFTRPGFSFAGWNTAGDGAGTRFVNHAIYQFSKSITLFAQWHVVVVPVFPAVHAVVTLRPFADKSAALSPTLEAQIATLATEIKANHDTKIALVGFSSDLTTSNEINEAAWGAALLLSRQRALTVETYLEQRLASLGLTGFTVTAAQSGKALSNNENATAANRAKNNKVVATLT
jgi:hypothetical protein